MHIVSGVPMLRELRLEVPVAVEHLDALVADVGDVDVALRVDRQALHAGELTVPRAGRAPLRDELAVLVELRDAVGVADAVGDVDVAGAIPRDVGRTVERRAGRARAGQPRHAAPPPPGAAAGGPRAAGARRRRRPPRAATASAAAAAAGARRDGRRSLRAFVRARARRVLPGRTSRPGWPPRRSSRRCPADRRAGRSRR